MLQYRLADEMRCAVCLAIILVYSCLCCETIQAQDTTHVESVWGTAGVGAGVAHRKGEHGYLVPVGFGVVCRQTKWT